MNGSTVTKPKKGSLEISVKSGPSIELWTGLHSAEINSDQLLLWASVLLRTFKYAESSTGVMRYFADI